MNMGRLMRVQILALAGLGALALIAGPARAGALGHDGARQVQVATGAQTSTTQSWAANGDFAADAATAGAESSVLTKAEAELGRAMLTDTILLAIVLSGMVLILVYTTFATRTRRELRPVLGDRIGEVSYGSAAGAASR
jgi:hypothetical protein